MSALPPPPKADILCTGRRVSMPRAELGAWAERRKQSGNHSTSPEGGRQRIGKPPPPQSAAGLDREYDREWDSGARKRAQISRYSLVVSANGVVPPTAASVLARAGQGMGAARVGRTRILFFDACRLEIPSRAILRRWPARREPVPGQTRKCADVTAEVRSTPMSRQHQLGHSVPKSANSSRRTYA